MATNPDPRLEDAMQRYDERLASQQEASSAKVEAHVAFRARFVQFCHGIVIPVFTDVAGQLRARQHAAEVGSNLDLAKPDALVQFELRPKARRTVGPAVFRLICPRGSTLMINLEIEGVRGLDTDDVSLDALAAGDGVRNRLVSFVTAALND